MKRVFVVVLLVLLSAVAFAQIPMMIGIDYSVGNLAWKMQSSNYTLGSATYFNLLEVNFPKNKVGFFFDAHFVRVGASFTYMYTYFWNGDYSNNIRTASGSTPSKGFTYQSIDVSVIGKIPFSIGTSANIWIGAGIEYSINIAFDMTEDGTNEYRYGGNPPTTDGRDMNDLYGIVAMGASVDMTESIALVPTVSFGWNFTPYVVTDAYLTDSYGGNVPAADLQAYKDNNKYTMFKYDIGIGIAIKL